MKKLILLLALILSVSLVFADSIDLGKFPRGQWIDSNWNAVWEFGANNIRILDNNGTVMYDFDKKITDFKVDVTLTQAQISFTCIEAERTYVFTKGIKDLGLTMEIDPTWSEVNYTVQMPFKN